jgi:hypothetical protein
MPRLRRGRREVPVPRRSHLQVPIGGGGQAAYAMIGPTDELGGGVLVEECPASG